MMKRQVRISSPQVLISSLILLITAGFATAGTLNVPTRTYPTIQSAINAAVNGDIVVVAPGTYSGYGNVDLDFSKGLTSGTRAITVRSKIDPENPDWNIIAATIIDCQGDKYNPRRAFHFDSGEGPDSKVMGFTIKNGYARGSRGNDGDVNGVSVDPDDPNFVRAKSGADANAPGDDGYGGSILCEGASPTIKYCVITNSTVTGGQGGDGAVGLKGPWQGTDPDKAPYDDGQWGGHGGNGEGNGYGGAIACKGGSSPIISDCIITDNIARGGRGGDGGHGGEATGSEAAGWDGRESGSGDGGEGKGDGFGGGIYAENGSSPIITNCTFSNNIATEGLGGAAGARGQGNVYTDPPSPLDGEPGWSNPDWSNLDIAGGAAWYGHDSDPNFTNCTFTNNKAYYDHDPNNTGWFLVYTVGGALYSDDYSNSTITLDTCEFTGNLGGAVYGGIGCDLDVDNSLFQDNSDTASGGAIYIGSGGIVNIQNSTFTNNSAYSDGGALKLRTNATLTNCSFGSNEAGNYGGAVDAYSGAPITVDVNNCNFAGNQATWGGGFSSETFTATFTNSYFINNTAQRGGGLDLVYGDISITGGVISGNKATDDNGGGLNCVGTDTVITDCTIKDNIADGADGHGGAIYFDSAATTQIIKNCLITGNSATANGGAISCYFQASPTISNCTFSNNIVTSLSGKGGALFCDLGSDPTVINSIFENCRKVAIYENDTASDVTLSYSLFYNNNEGDYYDADSDSTYTGAGQINAIPDGLASNNFDGDPDFVSGLLGEFYLNQTSSPAVNNGWNTAVYWGLDSYTTDADNALDSGTVDIGYHYIDIEDADTFQVTASVVPAADGEDHGTIAIEPPSGPYYAGTTVTLTVTPDSGWRVKTWSGTDNDSSTKTTNTVVMCSNRTVTVEFEQTRTLIVAVGGGDPGYYSNIQDAIHDANDGDTIIVYPGTYRGPEIQINKSIEIRSKHPDDPAWVAATIIDRSGGYNNRAFVFEHGTDGAILNGFTIQNSRWFRLDGDDAENVGQNGEDGIGTEGGAIYIGPGTSPIIKNCIIRNNQIRGGHGGNGFNADATHNAGRGGWGAWARGGAIYCGTNSSPTFINCQIIDNTARGGNGGNGGDGSGEDEGWANYGGNWSRAEWWNIDPRKSTAYNPYEDWVAGDLWETWDEMAQQPGGTQLHSHYYIDGQHYFGYFGDYRWYSGYGGGVYAAAGSNVTFIDCTISGNLAQGGMSGVGGERPGDDPEPEISYEIPSFGGGVYAAADSTVTFIGCTITDNISSEPELSDPNDPNSGLRYRLDPYLGHGGGVAAEDTAVITFIDSTFGQNEAAVGGGLFFANANPRIIDSDFTSNSAFHGGGLFGEHGQATIIGSNFSNNVALSDYDPNYTEEVLGEGGGLHLWATEANVIDCNISNNQAEASGGGIYFGGENAPSLINCLVTDNTAGRDGGGVSANIFTQLTISNSTIADNTVTGTGFNAGYGGGLYSSYGNYTTIINSIIWGNSADNGLQIAIGTGFEYDESPSTVGVTYSDVQGGATDVFIDPNCTLDWDDSTNLAGTPGDPNSEPLFVNGYYLSQTAAGQDANSACVDKGSDIAHSLDMYRHTTRTDVDPPFIDAGTVDMGYHYILTTSLVGDFDFDGDVDWDDYDLLRDPDLHWLEEGGGFPDWIHGKDLSEDGRVNLIDEALFKQNWKEKEITPPTPDPMTWAIAPRSAGETSITMTATTATNNSGSEVTYQFECMYGEGNSRDWDPNTTYVDTGLVTGEKYGYRVRAKDASDNKTEWSFIGYAITGESGTEPGAAEPPTWVSVPSATSPNSISMEAATSDSGGIGYTKYYFEETSGNPGGSDSVWQTSPTYEDTGLDPNTTYTYRVKAVDENGKETGWSTALSVTTLVEGTVDDTTPPVTDAGAADPYKSTFEVTPYEYIGTDGKYYHTMTATAATDDTGPVEYYFYCYSNEAASSGWQESPTYDVVVGSFSHDWWWQVKTRDSVVPVPNEGNFSDYYNTDGRTTPYP